MRGFQPIAIVLRPLFGDGRDFWAELFELERGRVAEAIPPAALRTERIYQLYQYCSMFKSGPIFPNRQKIGRYVYVSSRLFECTVSLATTTDFSQNARESSGCTKEPDAHLFSEWKSKWHYQISFGISPSAL
jgi:hypothetical protein